MISKRLLATIPAMMEIQQPYLMIPLNEVPVEDDWLSLQTCPVIAYGDGEVANADVVVDDKKDAQSVIGTIEHAPIAALTLVQVLRATQRLTINEAIIMESLAYAALQAGREFKAWLKSRQAEPKLIAGGETA